MPSTLKRKGSQSLEEIRSSEPSKRRFAEAEADPQSEASTTEPTLVKDSSEPTSEPVSEPKVNEKDTDTDSTISAHPPESEETPGDRAMRFALLRARNKASRKSNLAATKREAQVASSDVGAITGLQRKRDAASHNLLRAEIEDAGGDFERKRAWDWTAEEAEAWDRRAARKERAKEDVAFRDYAHEAGKVYKRQLRTGLGEEEARKQAYESEKREAIERAVKSGGLEIVETADGELIAVDRDGSFYSTADSTSFTQNKPSRPMVDRLVDDIKKAEEARMKKRRDRGRADADDGGDVTYINEKNKQFNLKLARFYNKYTADIRQSFERGTAI